MSFLLNVKKNQIKKNKERKKDFIPFISSVYVLMNCFIIFFMIQEATRYTRNQSFRQHKPNTMQMKSKLYLRIILLINYMMEENLFVYVECSSVKHAASRFSVRKNATKKIEKKERKKVTLDGLISQVQVLSVFYPEVPCTTLR